MNDVRPIYLIGERHHNVNAAGYEPIARSVSLRHGMESHARAATRDASYSV